LELFQKLVRAQSQLLVKEFTNQISYRPDSGHPLPVQSSSSVQTLEKSARLVLRLDIHLALLSWR
jgi:hypothetical protein